LKTKDCIRPAFLLLALKGILAGFLNADISAGASRLMFCALGMLSTEIKLVKMSDKIERRVGLT